MDEKLRCSVGEVWTYHKTVFQRRIRLLWKNGWARGTFVTSVALLLGVLAVGPSVGWEVTFGEPSEFSINLYTVIGTLAVVVFLSAIVAWFWAPAEIDKSQRDRIAALEPSPKRQFLKIRLRGLYDRARRHRANGDPRGLMVLMDNTGILFRSAFGQSVANKFAGKVGMLPASQIAGLRSNFSIDDRLLHFTEIVARIADEIEDQRIQPEFLVDDWRDYFGQQDMKRLSELLEQGRRVYGQSMTSKDDLMVGIKDKRERFKEWIHEVDSHLLIAIGDEARDQFVAIVDRAWREYRDHDDAGEGGKLNLEICRLLTLYEELVGSLCDLALCTPRSPTPAPA